MAVNLSIKNVPDSLAEALRTRAEQNHRSLQGELMSILQRAVAVREPEADDIVKPARNSPKLSIDEVITHAAKLFPKGTSSSEEFIRTMRDSRYGEEWARTGRHVQTD